MKSVNPYLNFNGNCEEVFNFYQSVFGGELQITRYKDLENQMGLEGDDLNKIANVSLPLVNGVQLYGSDSPDTDNYRVEGGNQIQITIETESREEAEQLFSNLSKRGQAIMTLQETEWAERFAIFTDKFGIQWMIMYAGDKN